MGNNELKIFENSEFSGDISCWNFNKVVEMGYMFFGSKCSSDISSWRYHAFNCVN